MNEMLKPPTIFENVPADLRDRPQWLLWKYEDRGGKPTKVPYQSNGYFAKSNDPSTWGTFKEGLAALQTGRFSGIGFAFREGDGLCGIDLDHCFVDGQLKPWASEILERFQGAYVEISPGGDGLHIWCQGTPLRTGAKKWRDADGLEQGIEVYNWY